MTLDPLSGKKSVKIVSVYIPTMTNSDYVKEKFYEKLESEIDTVPKSSKLIILGNFNVRIGTDHTLREGARQKWNWQM